MRIIYALPLFLSLSLVSAVDPLDEAKTILLQKQKPSSTQFLGDKNPIRLGLGALYSGVVSTYDALIESANSSYENAVEKVQTTAGSAQAKVMDRHHRVKAQISALRAQLKDKSLPTLSVEELIDLIEDAPDNIKEAVENKVKALAEIAARTDKSVSDEDAEKYADIEEANKLLTEISVDFLGGVYEQVKDLVPEKECVGVMGHIKYYAVQVLALVVKVIEVTVRFLLSQADIAAIVTGIVCVAAAYLSYRLAVSFVRVFLWISAWIITLPFRVVYHCVRYIFGYDRKIELSVDVETIKAECGDKTQRALPDSKILPVSGSPRRALFGDDDDAADDLIDDVEEEGEDLVEDVDEDELVEDVGEDVAELANATEAPTTTTTKNAPMIGSAAGYSTAMALGVAVIALIL